jgi:hypothetical protein
MAPKRWRTEAATVQCVRTSPLMPHCEGIGSSTADAASPCRLMGEGFSLKIFELLKGSNHCRT